MPAQLSIGLTSGTVTPVTGPDGKATLGMSYRNNVEQKQNIDNGTLLTMTGSEKTDLEISFRYKDNTAFNGVKTWCNVPYPYWVKVEDGSTVFYSGLAYLVITDRQLDTETGTFYSDFTIKVIAK